MNESPELINDEFCPDDEEFYDEIDPTKAFSCFQCNMEYFPPNFVTSDKVYKYVLCRWHLGVSKCGKCKKIIMGLGTIRLHRQTCLTLS